MTKWLYIIFWPNPFLWLKLLTAPIDTTKFVLFVFKLITIQKKAHKKAVSKFETALYF